MSTSTRPGATPGRAAQRRAPRPSLRIGAIGLTTVVVASLATVATGSPAHAAPAVPTFINGLAQPVFSTSSADWVNYDLWVESEADTDGDGRKDRIHVDISRPRETETEGLKVPVVYEVSPYYTATNNNVTNWPVDHELGFPPATKPPWTPAAFVARSPVISTSHESTYVPRGYAVMHAESIGSGLSDGCPTIGDVNETLGAKAPIDWLNGRAKGYTTKDGTVEITAPWTTGKVGMIGTSYNATLPNAVATTGVEGLEAIIPSAGISNWYDYYRNNGHVLAAGGFQGEDADVLADYVYTRQDRAVCQSQINQMRIDQDRVTGDYTAFWDARNYMKDEDNVKAAVLIGHGLNDWNVKIKNSVQFWEALKDNGNPRMLYLHQGGHNGTLAADMANRWFTRFLWDHQNGVENGPKAYVVPQGGSNNAPTAYADWPLPESAPVKLDFTAGADSTSGALGFTESPAGTTQTISDDATKNLARLANTKSTTIGADAANRLIFRTPVLTQPVRISGTTTLDIKASFNRTAANISVALVDYNPAATGTTDVARVVTRGWIDPQNHGNLYGRGHPLINGQEYTLKFDAVPHDWVFAAGRQIGVVVYSSDNEFTIRPAPGTQLGFNTQASSITLPIVGGVAALAGSTSGKPWPSGAIDDLEATVTSLRAEGRLSASTTAGLLDRLEHASEAAAAGSELRTITYIEQYVARVNNQVRNDPAARAMLLAGTTTLLAELRAADESELMPDATPTWPGNDWLNQGS